MAMYNNSTNFNVSSGNITGMGVNNVAFYRMISKVSITFNVLLAIGIIVSNILILGTVFTTPTLRRELRYLMVSSLAFGDLLLGLAGVPLYIDFTIQEKITVACEVHVVLQVLVIHGHVMITNLGLLIINIDYVIKQYDYTMPHFNPAIKLPVYIALSLVPWIVMFVVIPPLITTGLHENVVYIWSDTMCPVLLYTWARLTLNILCFFAPLLGMIITTCIIIYGFVAQSRGNIAFRPTLLNDEKPMFHPKFIIAVNVLCLLLLLPEHIVHSNIGFADFKTFIVAYMVSFLFAMSKGLALPIVWLLVPEVNEAFRDRCSLSYWRTSSDAPQHVVNKTYKEFVREAETTD
ncbi:5-hydroxytryptamine receptor 2C [Patella vulgata]|uniref:5-hydroxytryptamine receptor 2C n=1 Tax=Patella vulgata TaxID=6465 RepID=UPI0024A7E3BB|nr:5-hydroxytryptamine receptor 2C [Patella vulgata]